LIAGEVRRTAASRKEVSEPLELESLVVACGERL
jgi:hypothetical protein